MHHPFNGDSTLTMLITGQRLQFYFKAYCLSRSFGSRSASTVFSWAFTGHDSTVYIHALCQANKQKGVVNIIDTPDYCGDKDIHDILKFIGAEADTSTKTRKKHKNREEEKTKKRCKNSDKLDDEKYKMEDTSSSRLNDEVSVTGSEINRKNKEKEEDRKISNNKKNKNDTGKKAKNAGTLRESSSVEDLVSKSKQSDSVRDMRKQVTVDDGDMALEFLHTYHAKKVDPLNNFIVGGNKYRSEDNDNVKNESEGNGNQSTSDFVADFYSAGDSFLTTDVSQSPASPSGDFEVVSSKKRNKKPRSGSQTASQSSKSGGSDRWSGGSNSGSVYSDDNFRGTRFCPSKCSVRPNPGHEKPHINFSEGPRIMHENMFFPGWDIDDRHGERQVTASATHSEDSDSDGDVSAHSMPVPSITPRPEVRKPPYSSGPTPQASYANITKLTASANPAQMKRMSSVSNQSGTSAFKELIDKDFCVTETDLSDAKLAVTESRPTNILDDNFPSLTESLMGSCPPPSTVFTSKTSELRTNPSCESALLPLNVANVQEVSDKSKDLVSFGVRDGDTGSPENVDAVTVAVTSHDVVIKSPVPPQNASPPPPTLLSSHYEAGTAQHTLTNQPFESQHIASAPPPTHTQPPPARAHHYQNTKFSQQNTHSTSSQNAPPLFYQYQRHNPFNRKDDESSSHHRFPPPPIRPLHLNPPPNGALAYTPVHALPQFKQPPPQQPKSGLNNPVSALSTSRCQLNSLTQSGSHPQRNNLHSENALSSTVQAKHSQDKAQPPYNMNSQQYPQHNAHTQRNNSSQSQCNSYSQSNLNELNLSSKNPGHHPNNLQPQVNSHKMQVLRPDHAHLQKLSSLGENKKIAPDPCPLPSNPNHLQTVQQQSHSLRQNSCCEVELQVQPDQQLPSVSASSSCSPSRLHSSHITPSQNYSSSSSQQVVSPSLDTHTHLTCSLPVGERENCEDKHRYQDKNKPLSKPSDTSRLKKYEPAVVFTDNAKFDHNVSGLEFGFGFDEPIVASDSIIENDKSTEVITSEITIHQCNVTKDFSKWFQAPKNDIITYNYEELLRHVSN
ncbi:hypothetical protein SK128_002691, partial [Halocaridina rubra]